MRARDSFKQGFHFTMGAIIAIVVACCLLTLLVLLVQVVFSSGGSEGSLTMPR